MKRLICIMLATAVIFGGAALAQTQGEEPKAPGQPQPPPAGTPEQPKQTPIMCPPGMHMKAGQVCPMPGMDTQKLQKQIDELRQRVDALEAQLKKKK